MYKIIEWQRQSPYLCVALIHFMARHFVSIVFLFLVNAQVVLAQSEIKRTYNWVYGDNRHLRISETSFTDLGSSAMNAGEGSACISDTSGNLLFYTNGQTVWNKQHKRMPNGNGLFASGTVTQNSIIIPWPGQANKYLVFTNNYALYYSIVDMSLNGGLGDVTQKNVLIIDHIGEQLTACYHKNKNDVWIVVHQLQGNKLYSFLITNKGVNHKPEVSISRYTPSDNIGSLKISPNGKKIAFASFIDGVVELMCFNNENGRICRSIILSKDFSGAYSLEFSNNSTHLYVNAWYGIKLSQYDLTVAWNDIENTEVILNQINGNAGGMQLSADGSIYLCNVGRIQFPNVTGLGCNYTGGFYIFPIAGSGTLGLTNYMSSYFDTDTLLLDTTSCECTNEDIQLNIPNIITPNGDELNESLSFNNESFTYYNLQVFNRWGQLVFETSDAKNAFDGRTNFGQKLSSGTYFIIFQYQLLGNETKRTYTGPLYVMNDE